MNQGASPVNAASGTQHPIDRSRVVHLLIWAILALALAINLVALVSAWRWAHTPFLGILLEQRLPVSNVSNPAWLTGQQQAELPIRNLFLRDTITAGTTSGYLFNVRLASSG